MASGREHFGSSLTVIMAMAGSAIGLGNLWRFPYMVGKNGGAAFIVVYILCAIFLSMPIFFSEAIIGRHTQSNTFGAIEKLSHGAGWKWLGLITVIAPLIILSYYSVVGGWSVNFLAKSVLTGFPADASPSFTPFITSVRAPLIYHTVFLLLTAVIVSAGVKSGIEKFNKISLPLLFVLIVVIMVYSLTLPGAIDGVRYLVKPDFSKLTASACASAMGQSFFSLSLGVGCILTYSSYMKKEGSILNAGLGTAAFDLLFALIAGFAIMPAVFAADIEPGTGPGLIFETLPYIFSSLGASAPLLSRIISILFFVTIVVAALTSSISMYEVGVAYLVEERGIKRRKAVVIIFFGVWALGVLCSLSFGPLSGVHILGDSIFDFCDKLTSNFLMTFGSLLFTLFVGMKMKKADVRAEFTNKGSHRLSSRLFPIVYFFIRYIAPLVILAIFVTNLIL